MNKTLQNKKPKQEMKPQGRVPKLRFPEFRDAGEWEEKRLKKLAKKVTQKNSDEKEKRVLTNSAVDGIVDQRDYFDKDIANHDNLFGYYIVDLGDYVYNPRISTVAPVGPISKNKIGIGVMSPLYTVFRFNNLNNDFYEKYFKTTHWHTYMKVISNSGARHDRISITSNDFINMPIPYPCLEEQQKIADCLSSLDELIAAHSQKYDELKVYKKGLMQQLFPSEGETVPKLRFPEFRDAGEWEEKQLKNLAKKISQKNNDEKEKRVLTNSAVDGIVDQRNYFDKDIANPDNLFGYYIVELGDYVYNPRISIVAPVGPISKNKIGIGVMSPLYTVFRFNNFKNDFYEEYYKTTHWHKYIKEISNSGARHDRISITSGDFINMPIPYPSLLEQQKIADCLSSLDELISAQAQKIDTLKEHKKALMQQLFPSAEEVTE